MPNAPKWNSKHKYPEEPYNSKQSYDRIVYFRRVLACLSVSFAHRVLEKALPDVLL